MTKQQKLEAIYEAMADKTLSFGCRVEYEGFILLVVDAGSRAVCLVECDNLSYVNIEDINHGPNLGLSGVYYNLGHPVRIGDLLGWFDPLLKKLFDLNDDKSHDIYKDIICLWEKKRLPIDDQSEECIDFVYSLITK